MKKSYINPVIAAYIIPRQALCAVSKPIPPGEAEIVEGNVPARKLYV